MLPRPFSIGLMNYDGVRFSICNYKCNVILSLFHKKKKYCTFSLRNDPQAQLISQAKRRKEKIERFKQQKQEEAKLKELHKAVNRDHVDEEVKVIHSSISLDVFFYTFILQKEI